MKMYLNILRYTSIFNINIFILSFFYDLLNISYNTFMKWLKKYNEIIKIIIHSY